MLRSLLAPLIGNVFEWYEFTIYSALAPFIGIVFFGAKDEASGIWAGFLVYAVGYLSRPIGTIFFGHLGDKYGRKKALYWSLMWMALCALGVSCLPSAETIGIWAIVLLIILRALQGIGVSGELPAAITYACEISPLKQKLRYGSLAGASIPLGVLVGYLVAELMMKVFTAQEIIDFWWRAPFFSGFIMGVIGLWIRLKSPESKEFLMLEKSPPISSPLAILWKNEKLNLLNTILLMAALTLQGQFIYSGKLILQVFLHFNPEDLNLITIFSLLLAIIAAGVTGYIGSIFSFARLHIFIIIIHLTVPTLGVFLLNENSLASSVMGLFALTLTAGIGLGFYPFYLYQSFNTEVRESGVGISISIPVMVTGFGTMGMISLFNSYQIIGLYIYVGIVGLLILSHTGVKAKLINTL